MKETKEFLQLIFAIVSGSFKSAEDKEISLADLQHFLPAALSANDGIQGVRQIRSEYATATDEEKAELFTWAKREFDLPAEYDDIEAFVENLLTWGLGAIPLYTQLKALRNRA